MRQQSWELVVRVAAVKKNHISFNTEALPMTTDTRKDLSLWINVLEIYARDWDFTFEHRPNYFTQEFWYLLVGCLLANWEGSPLTVSAACQSMKSGSNRTREERIKKAVADGFLIKRKSNDDGREAIVIPTPKLETLMQGHFERTLKHALEQLKSIKR